MRRELGHWRVRAGRLRGGRHALRYRGRRPGRACLLLTALLADQSVVVCLLSTVAAVVGGFRWGVLECAVRFIAFLSCHTCAAFLFKRARFALAGRAFGRSLACEGEASHNVHCCVRHFKIILSHKLILCTLLRLLPLHFTVKSGLHLVH